MTRISPTGSPPRGFDDEQIVPISALQHFAYCPRQCGLIHLDQAFEENWMTLRGSMLHRRVDDVGDHARPGVRRLTGVWIWSDRLGISGRADLIEIRGDRIEPVEFKHGTGGRHATDVQLCAQAICIEERFDIDVHRGAVFEAARRRRRTVTFTPSLRVRTEAVIEAVRDMLSTMKMPEASLDARCDGCSLRPSCLPELSMSQGRLRAHRRLLFMP